MRKIKVHCESIRKVWENNFVQETNKFVKSTHLVQSDLGREYIDKQGNRMKLVGYLDGKELVSIKVETGELFGVDRWKVSEILHPEKHEAWSGPKKGKGKATNVVPKLEPVVEVEEEPEVKEVVEAAEQELTKLSEDEDSSEETDVTNVPDSPDGPTE